MATDEVSENSPKKRGRKPKIKQNVVVDDSSPTVVVAKKRGRKPKMATTPTPTTTTSTIPSEAMSPQMEKIPPPSREPDPIVLYLPIKDSDFRVLASFAEEERRNQILMETPCVIQPANEGDTGLLPLEQFHAQMTLQAKEDGGYTWVDENDITPTTTATATPLELLDGESPTNAMYREGPSSNVYVLREKYQPNLPEHLGGASSSRNGRAAAIQDARNGGTLMKRTIYDTKTFPLQLETPEDITKIKDVRVSTWCWHCCHPFDTFPVYFPVAYGPVRGSAVPRRGSPCSALPPKQVFKVKGCFCSFNCAMAWGDSLPIYFKESHALTRLMYKRLTGKTDGMSIDPAPSRYTLDCFGGCLSIAQFRASFHTLSRYTITEFPVIHVVQQIECQEPIPAGCSMTASTTSKQATFIQHAAPSTIDHLSKSKMDNAEKRLLRLKRSTKSQTPAGLDALIAKR